MKEKIKALKKAILDSEKIYLFPHVNPDGDAMGASVALYLALRKLGKKPEIILEENSPANFKFLDKDYSRMDYDSIESADLSIAIDNGDPNRFPERKELFFKAAVTACLDHHRTSKDIFDISIIVPSAAATGELVYELIKELEVELDVEIAEAIYTAILTDTGCFCYSNVTSHIHGIAAELMEVGARNNYVYRMVYETQPLYKVKLRSMAAESIELFADGKCAICHVKKRWLDELGAQKGDTDGIIEIARSVAGVKLAAFLREEDDEQIKVSMRVSDEGNVAQIAEKYGGGGHKKAAGFTLMLPLNEAMELVKKELVTCL